MVVGRLPKGCKHESHILVVWNLDFFTRPHYHKMEASRKSVAPGENWNSRIFVG